MKFMSLALAFLAAANASKCMIKVCNRSPTWLNIGAVASKKLDKYQRIGGVGKGKCQSMPCPDKSFLKVERGSKQVALMSDVSCGGTYNVCGYMVVNKSSQTVMAFVKKGMPMIIPAGQRATVAGVEGLPIHVVDPKTKAVHKVFKPKKCGRWLKLQESDCRPAPQPDPATPSPVRSPTGKPTSKPTSAPTGMPMQAANQSLTTSPTVEADVRSSDKCVPVDKCGTLKVCYFFDFVNGAEHSLDTPISAGHQFSIRCDTNGSIDKVVFFDSNGASLNKETTGPFWMHGHLPDGTLSRARPLAMCETREFTVHGSMTTQLDDEACFEERMSINAECPTDSPTGTPTSSPTEGPTIIPTATPTASPTEPPTSSPTMGPTTHPTEEPTASPTYSPTSLPTEVPTLSPTEEPTSSPTSSPTGAPTSSPVILESTRAGEKPSPSPTGAPVPRDTPSPTCVGHPTALRNECKTGYEKYGSQCVKKIPAISVCSRQAYYLHYRPNVPAGWQIQAKRAGTNESRFITITNSRDTKVYIGGRNKKKEAGSVERWFHSFRLDPYYLRFKDNFGRFGPWKYCTYNTPIGLDIDGSGAVERIIGTFKIDITGDGDIETLYEWFAPTEGILIDTAVPIIDGVISGLHLFGNSDGFSDGFAKLHSHDDDVDGDVEGAELETFAIWTDRNSNQKVDDGELSSLASHGIVSLSTFHDSYVSHATLEDGSSMYMEDLWFTSDSER